MPSAARTSCRSPIVAAAASSASAILELPCAWMKIISLVIDSPCWTGMALKEKAAQPRKKWKRRRLAAAHEVALAIRAAPRLRIWVKIAALDAGNGVGVGGKQLVVLPGRHRHALAGRQVEALGDDWTARMRQGGAAPKKRINRLFRLRFGLAPGPNTLDADRAVGIRQHAVGRYENFPSGDGNRPFLTEVLSRFSRHGIGDPLDHALGGAPVIILERMTDRPVFGPSRRELCQRGLNIDLAGLLALV